MSVITSYRTRIKLSPERVVDGEIDPTWRLMEEALETTAQEYGGRVTDRVSDAFGKEMRCPWALVTPDFPRGIGVRVAPDGSVTFIYDHYGGYRRVAALLCQRITQNYTALAVVRALGELNYSVEVDEVAETPGEPRAVVVRGSL